MNWWSRPMPRRWRRRSRRSARCRNFAALQALGARARYGFIEALDFTPARQSRQRALSRR